MTTTRRYEALIALNTRGKEEAIKETIERLEKTIAGEGAAIEQVQRLERRELAYRHNHLQSAYFVNIIFDAPPGLIEKIRARLKLDPEVTLQNYLQLPEKKAATAEA
ncbi:MAG: 30S ribosomal protein S6 [Terrimicrobiaceae bacterium]|nr:30S ribosomal protein S6 [Terrimicrobiaceae bacterium]